MQKGAAQPHVYAKDINALKMQVPPEAVIRSFCNATAPFFNKICVLQKQNSSLEQARDRLLPKLMNGEIEV